MDGLTRHNGNEKKADNLEIIEVSTSIMQIEGMSKVSVRVCDFYSIGGRRTVLRLFYLTFFAKTISTRPLNKTRKYFFQKISAW